MRNGERGPDGPDRRLDGHNSGWRRREGQSAQTFRRGRALAFLEKLHVMRNTLAAQLNEQEFEAIRPVICGELKAVDSVIQAFVHTFELEEESRRPDSKQPDSRQ